MSVIDETETKSAELAAEVDDDATEDAAEEPMLWESELAYEGLATSDNRYLIPGKIGNRELPLSLMIQTETDDGHTGAEICGKITEIWRVERDDLGEGVVAIMGSGEFAPLAAGPDAEDLVEGEFLRGVSIDLATDEVMLLDPETKEEVPEEDIDWDLLFSGYYLFGMTGDIMGATVCPFPAFAESTIRVLEPDAVTASAEGEKPERVFRVFAAKEMKIIPRTITASAAKLAPLAPPKAWFFTEEPDGKMPLTVTADGRVFGHLATWDQCHHGFQNECVLAKRSRKEYGFFHVGQIKTAEGEMVDIGRIVVGQDLSGGHAPISYGLRDTSKFYDKTACVGAFVRAIDGKYGIWLSGAVRSDCPAERVRDMVANPPSGDWRAEDGWLELVAALSVPVPGYPVPRYEYAMVASAGGEQVNALVATGYFELERAELTRAEQRRKAMLLAQARQLF